MRMCNTEDLAGELLQRNFCNTGASVFLDEFREDKNKEKEDGGTDEETD